MRWLPSLWVALTITATASAQVRLAPPRLPGESTRVAQRLAEAQDLVGQGQFADAIEEYQRLLAEAGDELLPSDPQQPHHLLPVRRIIQQRLAALPAAALRLYRGRVDPAAQKLLDQGRAQRDGRLLQQIVAEFFCSRHTDQALDLLGDLAFERGDFEEAERCWRMLTPPDKPDPLALVFPDPQIDVAQARAKQLLARWCRGDRQDADRQLAAYRQQHGQAAGHFAGRQGNYADILSELAKQLTPLAVGDDTTWPTFAGHPSRQHILATPPRCQWLGEPWRAPIEGAVPAMPGQSPSQTALAYAYHPVIAADRVIVADPRGVTVHDLWTGKRLGRWDLVEELKVAVEADDKQVPSPGARYTLAVAQDRIFVRLGAPVADGGGDSYLICLNLTDAKPTLRWQVKLEPVKDGSACFEGSPVVASDRVLIAWTRFSPGRNVTGIDCYDVASGARRWRQEVSESREPIRSAPPRQDLLSLAGPHMLCCNHGGAVVALDQETGKRAWAVRYPRRGYQTADGLPTPRDLAPPLAAAGRVYVAPADSDSIWCLDPASGRLLWQSQPVEVVHLLGVAGNRLIFTTGNRPRGIQALEASSGLLLRDWIYPGDGQTELPSLGRGFLAGDQVFFPRANGWDILKQADGRPDLDRFVPLGGLPPGNMASASGCLVVATDRELLGYVPADRQLPVRRKESAAEPRAPRSLVRLAHAEAAAGQYADALIHLDQAARLGDDAGRTEALRVQQQVWTALRAQPAEVMTLVDRPDLAAVRGQLLALAAQDRPQAAASWQRLLADAALCRGTILDPQGLPQPAGLHAARQIEMLKAGADTQPDIDRRPSFTRQSLPELGINLEVAGEAALNGETALALDGAYFLLDRQGQLTCRTETGKEMWSRFFDVPISWLGRQGDILIAGGSTGIARLDPGSGEVVWSILWPAWEWSSYQMQGGRLYARLDRRRLLAIDVEAGRSDWAVDTVSEFTDYWAAEDCVLARTAGSVGWIIEARTGRKDLSFTAQGLPVRFGEASLTVMSKPGRVTMLDRSTGKPVWHYAIDRAVSLSGEMPWLVHHGDALVVVVPRNHAVELIRLDRRDGKPMWRRSLALGWASTATDQVGTDGQSLFVVASHMLRALRLADGRTSWSAALPAEETWRLAVSRDLVIVHPTQARTRTDVARLFRRLSAADPTALLPTAGTKSLGTALAIITTVVIDGQSPSRITLLTYDPATGKRLQELELAAQGPRLAVTLQRERLLVATSKRVWTFR